MTRSGQTWGTWLRVVAQAVLVLCAVVAGLRIDRYWQDRAAAARDTRWLQTEVADLERDLPALDSVLERLHDGERATIRLVRLVDGDIPLPGEPIDSLLWQAFLVGPPRAEAARTGLDAARSWTTADDPTLRTPLAEWRAAHDRATEADARLGRDVEILLRPYLVRYALIRPPERVYDFFRDVRPGGRAYDFTRMLEDPEFEGLVLLRLEDQRRAVQAHDALVEATSTLIGATHALLASRAR